MATRKLTDTGGQDEGGGSLSKGSESLSRDSSTRGSFRKVLPSLPDMDQQMAMASRMIDRRTSTKRNHAYAPYFLEYTLLAEYNLLQEHNISGLYIIPAASSPLIWFGVIFVREGLYQEGIFRFTLHIPENFPVGDVPCVVFDTPVFHPLVDQETGELEVKKAFSNKWRTNVHHLWHVCLYIRRIFYKIEFSNPKNAEAAVLYESDQDMFELRARSCVAASKEAMYDLPKTNDQHAIRFSEYIPEIHDPVREQLKSEKKELVPDGEFQLLKGMSFVQPSSLTVFSKAHS